VSQKELDVPGAKGIITSTRNVAEGGGGGGGETPEANQGPAFSPKTPQKNRGEFEANSGKEFNICQKRTKKCETSRDTVRAINQSA